MVQVFEYLLHMWETQTELWIPDFSLIQLWLLQVLGNQQAEDPPPLPLLLFLSAASPFK